MVTSWNVWSWQLGLASSLAISGVFASFEARTFAQITPDATLGNESSVVTSFDPDQPVDVVSGGATRGANLFHSFQEFNVAAGRGAYFYSPNAEIQNIVTRVTGSNRSEILGLIGTYGNSNPNLFLINPNGIIFGSNARLDVSGSFVGSTASSLNFSDGTGFRATAQLPTSLLTVSVPIGLQFGGTRGNILVQGSGLAVQPGKALALVGGDVRLSGGTLQASGGRVELGAVGGSGTVGLFVNGHDLGLSFPMEVERADVSLTNQALVDTTGERSGDIQVQGRRVTLSETSRIYADTESQKGGGISIHASELIVRDGSQVSASTLGAGQGGTLSVTASESIELSGTVTTPDGTFPSSLIAQAENTGNAGSLTITTRKLTVQNGGQVATGTIAGSTGQGGTLTVNATDSVELFGAVETPERQITSGLFAQTEGIGNAGSLTITTRKLIAKNGGQVAAGAGIGSQGKGGNVSVTASELIELSGTAPNPQDTSGLFARTRGTGPAGNLKVATGELIIQDKAQVTVSGVGLGEAGNLEITAQNLRLDNEGAIVAETASGEGGNITLRTQDLLLLRRNSKISTTAGTEEAAGNGGNITINTGTLVALENSDITANAFFGTGGQVEINAQAIFGTQVREQESQKTSDITAISTNGPQLSGTVEINTLNFDPSSALASLPVEVVNVSDLIATGCPAQVRPDSSTFVYTGRGGTPPTPTEALNSDSVLVDLASPVQTQDNRAQTAPTTNSTSSDAPTTKQVPTQLVEAQGWVMSDNGDIVLTATPATATASIPWLTAANCHTAKTQS